MLLMEEQGNEDGPARAGIDERSERDVTPPFGGSEGVWSGPYLRWTFCWPWGGGWRGAGVAPVHRGRSGARSPWMGGPTGQEEKGGPQISPPSRHRQLPR